MAQYPQRCLWEWPQLLATPKRALYSIVVEIAGGDAAGDCQAAQTTVM